MRNNQIQLCFGSDKVIYSDVAVQNSSRTLFVASNRKNQNKSFEYNGIISRFDLDNCFSDCDKTSKESREFPEQLHQSEGFISYLVLLENQNRIFFVKDDFSNIFFLNTSSYFESKSNPAPKNVQPTSNSQWTKSTPIFLL